MTGSGAAGTLAQVNPLDWVTEVVDTSAVTGLDFVWAIVTLVVGFAIARIVRIAIRRYAKRSSLPANIVDLLSTIATWTIMAVAVVFALTFLGLNVAPLWLLLLFIIIAFAVGGREIVEAFSAGILLQARAPFEQGDLVTIVDETGVVVEVNSRVTVLDAVDGRRILVPNREVLANPIHNLTHRRLRMSSLDLDVVYGTDLDEAAAIAVASLTDVEAVLPKPEPVAEVRSFDASAIRIRLRFWHPSDLLSEWTAVDGAARSVARAFADGGVTFAFPQRTLWWGDGGDTGGDAGRQAEPPA